MPCYFVTGSLYLTQFIAVSNQTILSIAKENLDMPVYTDKPCRNDTFAPLEHIPYIRKAKRELIDCPPRKIIGQSTSKVSSARRRAVIGTPNLENRDRDRRKIQKADSRAAMQRAV